MMERDMSIVNEMKAWAETSFAVMRTLLNSVRKPSDAQKAASITEQANREPPRILIDKDGNPTLNFQNKEVLEQWQRSIEALSKWEPRKDG